MPKKGVPVAPEEVEVIAASPRRGKGDGDGGEYWEIRVAGKHVGEVFVNLIEEPPLGPHASMQIALVKTQQRRGIGRIAYRLAAEASRHDSIHLHIRRSNPGSCRAAEHAGFLDATPAGHVQLIMRRDRRS